MAEARVMVPVEGEVSGGILQDAAMLMVMAMVMVGALGKCMGDDMK
ncbi:hypothetical protein E2C01_088697 [Portunus trituberculatus]|uniref:Uncharacterized protein n=1 Tax=Portunus trituberculatus TaxID=210409 RepID=A0A5B7JMK6_PORTR|nr:hypothetical protein [Portunus trituberculatus]